MEYLFPDEIRVLAIDPTTRGIGFAVLEGPERLVDWGVKQAGEDKNAECVEIVRELIDRYRRHALVIEDAQDESSLRRERVGELLEDIRRMARERRVKVLDVTPNRIRQAFAPKKDVIAAAIAGRFPELQPRLPKMRTLRMSEQYKMPVFDAMSFALTFFYQTKRKKLSQERQAVREAIKKDAA